MTLEPKHSPTWQNGIAVMRYIIRQERLSKLERFQKIARTELFAVNCADFEERRLSITQALRHHYPAQAEAECYPPELMSVIGGKLLSCDFMKKSWLAALAGYGHQTVLEVGAGFGQVARIMLLSHMCERYVIIDLPETLWFAEVFLRTSLPSKTVVFAHTKDALELKPDILLVPAELAQHFKQPVDCFLNSSSLGEMDNSFARLYINMAQDPALGVKKLVLLNRLMNTYNPTRECNRERECGWYFMLDNQWCVPIWELEPAFTRLPYEQAMHHRELLFVALREPREQAMPELSDVAKQRWFSHPSTAASVRRANQMFIDNNTARRLFESVRRGPTVENVDMLIKYLLSFGKLYPFEEEQYLAALYEKLSGKRHPLTHGPFERLWHRASTALAQWLWRRRLRHA